MDLFNISNIKWCSPRGSLEADFQLLFDGALHVLVKILWTNVVATLLWICYDSRGTRGHFQGEETNQEEFWDLVKIYAFTLQSLSNCFVVALLLKFMPNENLFCNLLGLMGISCFCLFIRVSPLFIMEVLISYMYKKSIDTNCQEQLQCFKVLVLLASMGGRLGAMGQVRGRGGGLE